MPAHPLPVAPEGLWDRPDMADALRRRDMSGVLVLFRRWTGATQSQLARMIGISQGYASEILAGKRQVTSLDMYERIVDGLGIPPERVGLASRAVREGTHSPGGATPTRRTALAAAAAVASSAQQSAAFIERFGIAMIDGLALEQLSEDVARLSLDYIVSPPDAVVVQAKTMRDTVLTALERERRLGPCRDLTLVAGQLGGILAYVALDLGDPAAAMTNARSALLCAEMAGHTGLAGWSRGTQSLIARYTGRYAEAEKYLAAGVTLQPTGIGLARLASGQAQCRAHFGDAAGTRAALAAADSAHAAATPGEIETGVFGFPRSKVHYYAASSLIWLHDHEGATTAVREARTAIELFQTGPADERFVTDEILAHVYGATAHVQQGEVDAAAYLLAPVLEMPADRRVSWHRSRLTRLSSLLSDRRPRGASGVADLRERIAAF